MAAPLFGSSDYQFALQALLPRGRVWPRDGDAVQTAALGAFSPTWFRSNARMNQLLVDGFPSGSIELLSEWEETLGLPDPCAGESPTVSARRAQVVARIQAQGAQSVAYFIALAAKLGYAITITQFAPFRFGQSTFGTPMYGTAWAFAWQVNAPQFSIHQFQFGADAFGEPLSFWNNNVLQCELQQYAPAHTYLLFAYS